MNSRIKLLLTSICIIITLAPRANTHYCSQSCNKVTLVYSWWPGNPNSGTCNNYVTQDISTYSVICSHPGNSIVLEFRSGDQIPVLTFRSANFNGMSGDYSCSGQYSQKPMPKFTSTTNFPSEIRASQGGTFATSVSGCTVGSNCSAIYSNSATICTNNQLSCPFNSGNLGDGTRTMTINIRLTCNTGFYWLTYSDSFTFGVFGTGSSMVGSIWTLSLTDSVSKIGGSGSCANYVTSTSGLGSSICSHSGSTITIKLASNGPSGQSTYTVLSSGFSRRVYETYTMPHKTPTMVATSAKSGQTLNQDGGPVVIDMGITNTAGSPAWTYSWACTSGTGCPALVGTSAQISIPLTPSYFSNGGVFTITGTTKQTGTTVFNRSSSITFTLVLKFKSTTQVGNKITISTQGFPFNLVMNCNTIFSSTERAKLGSYNSGSCVHAGNTDYIAIYIPTNSNLVGGGSITLAKANFFETYIITLSHNIPSISINLPTLINSYYMRLHSPNTMTITLLNNDALTPSYSWTKDSPVSTATALNINNRDQSWGANTMWVAEDYRYTVTMTLAGSNTYQRSKSVLFEVFCGVDEIAPATGPNGCVDCGSGFYSPEDSNYCYRCPLHYLCGGTGGGMYRCPSYQFMLTLLHSCAACPAGYSCTSTAMAVCSSNYYSLAGWNSCTYNNNWGLAYKSKSLAPVGCSSSQFHSYSVGSYTKWCLQTREDEIYQATNQAPTNCATNQTLNNLAYPTGCEWCPAGVECPGFKYSQRMNCIVGTYSLNQQKECNVCGGGYRCTSTSTTQACSSSHGSGYFSAAGMITCEICPEGHECSDSAQLPNPCADGWVAPAGYTYCTKCLAGRSCEDVGDLTGTACPSGQYSAAGDMFCHKCPVGYECTTSQINSQCSSGYYSPLGQYSCTQCTPGYYCPLERNINVPCPTGYYQNSNGQTSCIICPVGKYCNNGGQYNCPARQYSDRGMSSCKVCPEGYYCEGGASSTPNPIPGPPGRTCASNQYRSVDCGQCSAGSYCPSPFIGDKLPCPSSSVSYSYSAGGKAYCTYCTNGYSCSTSTPTICPGLQMSGPATSGCISCTDNHACKYKNWDYSLNCPPYTYSVGGELECHPIIVGYEMNLGTMLGQVACLSGEYSTGFDDRCQVCPTGHRCPNTNKGPIPCLFNEYQHNTNQTVCLPIGSNVETWNKHTQPTPCQTGYYSPYGENYCRVCPDGYSCSSGGVKTQCGVNYYSPQGDKDCHICTSAVGAICPSTSGWPQPCPPGMRVLNNGQCSACPTSGQYSLGSVESCTNCPAGFHCYENHMYPIMCPRGHYSGVNSRNCTRCSDGYMCEPGSVVANPAGFLAPPGYYSEHNVYQLSNEYWLEQVIPCAAGTYYSSTGKGSPCTWNCPQGYFCPPGTADASTDRSLICPKGHYCPTGTTYSTQNPCSAGTYNGLEGRWHISQCLGCGGGTYCPSGSHSPTLCPPGYVCPPNSGALSTLGAGTGKCSAGTYNPTVGGGSCISCPKGFYCEEGVPSPVYCPAGRYRSSTGGTQESDCSKCPIGIACPSIGSPSVEIAMTCPPGYICGEETKYPYEIPCVPGTYSDTSGESNSGAACKSCPPGFACLGGTNKFTTPMLKCNPGYFCSGSNITPTPASGKCTEGSYGADYGGKSQSDCTPCTPGHVCGEGISSVGALCGTDKYCLEGTTTSTGLYPGGKYCPAGTYHPGISGLKSLGECLTCPAGSYCEGGLIVPPQLAVTPCPIGTYNPIPKKGVIGDCLPCIMGYKCGTGSSTITPCGIGYYSDTGWGDCTICPLGHYCRSTITTQTLMNSQECAAGYLCLEGTGEHPTAAQECRLGSYCLKGAKFPIDCEKGSFNPLRKGDTSAVCLPSPAGYYVNTKGANAPTGMCDPGYYCLSSSINSMMSACPSKTFRDLPGAKAHTDCGECPAGYFCAEGTIYPIECPAGHYCTTGVVDPEKCPMGTFGPSKRLRARHECTDCWQGRFCADVGLINPSGLCDPGYHCNIASETPNPFYDSVGHARHNEGWRCVVGGYCLSGSTYNLPCPSGKYANTIGSTGSNYCGSCTQRKYCLGTPSSVITGSCTAGYYCPTGSSKHTQNICNEGYYCPANSYTQNQCLAGTFTSHKGEASCRQCPAGFYCSGNRNTGVFTKCLAGYYCPAGASGPSACPQGTYMPDRGSKQSSDCIPCKPGQYCYSTHNVNPDGNCNAGYFCKSYSPHNTPGQDGSGRYGRCPAGHYCVAGTADPMPCPMGRYYSGTHCGSEGCCPLCTQGYYCPDIGLTIGNTAAYICTAGYYCPSGTIQPHDGIKCTPGYKCPTGRASKLACSAGTYQDGYGEAVCKTCPKGYYCTSTSSTFEGRNCPVGYYCPAGTQYSTQYACPAGTYNPIQNAGSSSYCIPAPPGYYCQSAHMSSCPNKCSQGYYCSGRSPTHAPSGTGGNRCSPGYYCPTGAVAPIECDPGKYCAGYYRPSPNGNCNNGYYCLGKGYDNTPRSTAQGGDRCSPGYYCPSGCTRPIPCPPGTYRGNYNKYARSHCYKCTDGYYCRGPAATSRTGYCDPGYYCVNANSSDTSLGHSVKNPPTHRCPIGYRCPGLPTSANKISCAGEDKYQIYPGQSVCQECPAGFECTGSTKVYCDNSNRNESIYCPANQNANIGCGAGNYNMVDGSSVSGDCKSCPPGYYCPNTLLTFKLNECVAGTYCSGGVSSAGGTGTCQAGYYCPAGTAYQIPCPSGKYCPGTGNTDVIGMECANGYWCKERAYTNNPTDGTRGVICPTGHYCPSGCREPIKCPHGNYNPNTGRWLLSHCLNCTQGYECPRPGLSSTPSANLCPVGYYCPLNTTQGEHLPCPKGHKCPTGTHTPVLCTDSTFNPMPMQGSCQTCPPRMYCYNSDPALTPAAQEYQAQSPRECPLGFYCASGSGNYNVGSKRCPAGRYGSRTGLSSSSECDPCPPGYYCPTTGMIPSDLDSTKYCNAGYICYGGASIPNPQDSTGRLCSPGFYCFAGDVVDRPCPPGTYAENSYTGKATEGAGCKACPAGRYCPFRGKYWSFYGYFSGNNYKCTAGFVCISGSSTPTPYYTKGVNSTGYHCPPGYYCPRGTTNNNEIVCDNGYWQPYPAQGSCISSPSGRMSLNDNVPHSLMTHLTDCPPGYYCSAGTRSLSYAHKCPAGTYSTRVNLESSSECYPCDPGMYCSAGRTSPNGPCNGGYVCPRGSGDNTPTIYIYKFSVPDRSGICPKGYYCPPGSKKPMPCPRGSYMNSYYNQNTACYPCPGGYYCDTLGLNTYSKRCANGYICIGGAKYAKPSDGITGRLCAKGHYCISGIEYNCGGGSYEPREGSSGCQTCPMGYTCAVEAVLPVICPVKYYCTAGRSTAQLCPSGTYSLAVGLQSAAQCRECITGSYCTGGAIIDRCDSGYFCKTGASTRNPAGMECPIGHFCEKSSASVLPVICPVGKVRSITGGQTATDCSDCPQGEYCIEGLTSGYACPKGYYCPARSQSPSPCPVGKYINYLRAFDVSQCLECGVGYYCNVTGIPDKEFYSCLPGLYCPGGFDSSGNLVEPVNCSEGTYRNLKGASQASECLECTGGSYCLTGTITPTGCLEGTYCPPGSVIPLNCTEGNYCPHGAEEPITCPQGFYCPAVCKYPIKCENGFYCPNGTVQPNVCPPGTMGSNNPQNIDESSGCAYCRAGYYSAANEGEITDTDPITGVVINNSSEANEFGVEAPKCKICPSGYVCLGRTSQQYPTDIDDHMGYECPRGYYCPEGSYQPLPCPKGTFNNILKTKSLEECNKCDINTYSYLTAQRGCLPCSGSARAELGSEQCTCIGENRVFQFSTGACLCRPNYEPSAEDIGEDSESNCVPIVYERCPTNTLRSGDGKCIGMDECKVCPNEQGRRDPGVGICRCENVQDVDEVCDTQCRQAALEVKLDVDLNLVVTDPATNTSSVVDLVATQLVHGEPRYVEGLRHSVASISMNVAGGFSANYQPLPGVVKEYRRVLKAEFGGNMRERYLATTNDGGIASPVLCLNSGDTLMFALTPDHYPIYLKDHLANNQADFDYGSFTELESRMSEGATVDTFVFTFTQSGVFVLGDSSDIEKVTIIGVMGEKEKCNDPDKYIQPITYDSLLKIGVSKRDDIQQSPNWNFIIVVFLMMVVGIPVLIWFITFLHNQHGRKQALSQIQFFNSKTYGKKNASPRKGNYSVDEDNILENTGKHGLFHSRGSLAKKNKSNRKTRIHIEEKEVEENTEIDPDLFNEIYAELQHHADFMKKQFKNKSEKDQKNIIILYQEVMKLEQAMEGNLRNITKSIGVNNVKKLFKKDGLVRNEGEELANKMLIYDREASDTESDSEGDFELPQRIVDQVMKEDEVIFNKVILNSDAGKKEFLQTFNQEQKHIYNMLKQKVEELPNLDTAEKEELLKEFDKQMLTMNKMLIIEEEKQDADLKEKITERRMRRIKLKEKLQILHMKEMEAKKKFAHEASALTADRIALEGEIDQEFEDGKKDGMLKINKKKKKKMDKYESDFKEKMINLNSQKKIGKLLERYKGDTKRMAKILDNENKELVADLMQRLEKRKHNRLLILKNKVENKLNILDSEKTQQVLAIAEEQEKLTLYLKDEDLDAALDEVLKNDLTNKQNENEIIAKLQIDQTEREKTLEKEKLKELKTLKDIRRKEDKVINSEMEQEKRDLETKLKTQFFEAEQKRQELRGNLIIAVNEEEKQRFLKEITEFEELTTAKLNAERDKQLSSIQEKVAARKKAKRDKEEEINIKYEEILIGDEIETKEREQELKRKLREERMHRLIKATLDNMDLEEVPFAIDKIIEEQHVEELSDLLQDQFQHKAKELKHQVKLLLAQKLNELADLKEGFDIQYKRLLGMLEGEAIHQMDYNAKVVDVKQKEADKIRDLDLRFAELQNDIEERMIRTLEHTHGEQLIILKQEQYDQKKALLKQYVGDDVLEKALAGDDEWMNSEISKYKLNLQSLNAEKLNEIEKRKEKVNLIMANNTEKITQLDYQAKKLLEEQAEREKSRKERQYAELEDMRAKHEHDILLQGISKQQKKMLIDQHNYDIRILSETMDKERERQSEMVKRKLADKYRESERLKKVKDQQIALYKKEKKAQLDMKVHQIQREMYNYAGEEDFTKDPYKLLVERFEEKKVIYDKYKEIPGMDMLKKLQEVPDAMKMEDRHRLEEQNLESSLKKFDFDKALKKMSKLENKLAIFKDTEFSQIVEGCKNINGQLEYLRQLEEMLGNQ